jgi:hypothetical protein
MNRLTFAVNMEKSITLPTTNNTTAKKTSTNTIQEFAWFGKLLEANKL